MRLWADVYDAAGSRLGGGPVALTSASVTRVLDGVGTIRLSAPGSDPRALALLTNERRVRVYYQATDDTSVRELGRGVIQKVRASGTPANWTLDCEGGDDLVDLARVSTKLRRNYSQQSVSVIATSLVGLVSSWSVSASGGNTTDARFDGVSVFKALLGLAEQQGLHVRAGASAKTVEIGAFGGASGLRLVNPAQAMAALDDADEVALIETLSVEQDTEPLCTRLYPLGAGIGEAWLTIEKATRNLPYTRQVENVNGQDAHFLEDFSAIAQYGTIQKMGRFGQIAPLSNSEADQENAANALYDMAAAWLTRYSQRLDSYRVTCKKARVTVRPGDKIRLVYNGVVMRDGAVVHYLDVDDEFWVMECTERVGVEGEALDLIVASVDRHAQDSARIVIGALEELTIEGVSVKPYFNLRSYVFDRVIDPVTPAVIPVRITNATHRITRILLKLKTRSFVSTTLPEVTDNQHRHTIIQSATGDASELYLRKVSFYDEVTNELHDGALWIDIESDAFLLQTAQETADDEITLAYGLHEDTETPDTVRIAINATDYTGALSGPWAVGGGAEVIELDITAQILTEAGSNIQQEFLVTLTCDDGQGEIEATVEIYEIIHSIGLL
ncbi:MAG: hypothetical protein IPK19_19340 [Chloroflexi bacterium]|nr:hypothetical protein [Chloroflexota bacterium]